MIDYIEYSNKATEQKIENNKLSLRNAQMFKKINDLEKGHESIEEKTRFNLGFVKRVRLILIYNDSLYLKIKKMSDKKNEIIRVSAVIVAAGVGSRMSAGKPKQYIKVQGISILEHTINIFIKSKLIDEICVVISRDDIFFDKLG